MARRRLLFSYFYLTYNGNKYGETVNVSSFSEDGGTDSFSVTSSKEWNIVSSPSWITASVTSGGKGETSVTLTASVNEGTSEKTGSIVIKTVDDRYTATLYVTQDGIVPYIRINNNDADVNENVAFRSTISSYTIKSRGGWTLAITGGTTNVTAITDTNVVETALTINYPKNTDTGSSKTIKIVLTNTSDNTIKRTITLTQAAQSYITFTRNGADANVIPYNGEVGSILVKTNDIGYAFEESSQFELSKTLGLNNNETISYTAQTLTTANTATTVSISVTAKTSDYDASDNIDQKVYTYQYELYPYLNVANVNVSSASTTGSTTYSSNYNVINATPASQGITNIVVNNGNVTFTLPEPSWNDETYTLNLQTTGTVGPALGSIATITRPAKVAYLNTSNITVSKNAGDPTNNIIGAIDTNDTYTLDVTSGSDWLTYDPSTGKFSMTENTGTEDRTATITVTTTHNGSNGNPITKTITVTQEAIPTVEQNITVNLDMKQNSGGTWYIKTSTSNSSLSFPITISYGGNQFNTTVNGNFVQTPFTTAVGTQINTANISGTPSYLDADAHIRYNITYVMPTNVAYTETVQSLVPTSVELTYSDTDFLANGNASTTSQYSTPSNFVINYNEIITNSFDNTTRTVAKTESGLNHITSLDVTTSNGGTVNGTYNIGAANRGTTTGNSQTVAVIDKVNYTFSGQTYTYDIPNITFTQEANQITNVDTTQRIVYQDKGSSTNITGVTLNASEDSFKANGKTPNNNDSITVSATESGSKTYTSGVTTYTDSAVTYTSGAMTGITDTVGVAGTDITRTESYSASIPVTQDSKSGTSITYTSGTLTATNLGTTATTADSNKIVLKATSSDGTMVDTKTIAQEANIAGAPVYDSSSSSTGRTAGATTPHYMNIGFNVSRDDNGEGFDAAGKNKNDDSAYIEVDVTETGKTYSTTVYNYTGTSAYTVTYTSGEISAYTNTNTWTTTESGETTNYSNRAEYYTYGGDVFDFISTESNKQHAYGEDRGTVEGGARSGYITYRSIHDSSKEIDVTVWQDANYASTTTRTEYTDKGVVYSGVTVSITTSDDRFLANGNTPNGVGSIYVTATESYSYANASGVTVYTDTEYSSGAFEEDTTGTPDDDIYDTWTRTSETNTNIETTGGEGNSISYTSSEQRLSAENLGSSVTTASSNSIELTATANYDSSVTDVIRIYQDANVVEDTTCNISWDTSTVELDRTTTADTANVVSTTERTYSSEYVESTTVEPDISKSSNYIDVSRVGSSTNPYTYRISIANQLNYDTSFTVTATSPECTGTSDDLTVSWNGQQEIILPSITVGSNWQGDTWGFWINFDFPDNATTGITWNFIINYYAEFYDGSTAYDVDEGAVEITGTTDSNRQYSDIQTSVGWSEGTEGNPMMGNLYVKRPIPTGAIERDSSITIRSYTQPQQV